MTMRTKVNLSIIAAAVALAIVAGCDNDSYFGELAENMLPTIELTSGPLEGDTTLYRIEFSWVGTDRDGTVRYYEFVICDGSPLGFDPADTTGLDKWTRTYCRDSLFIFRADDYEKDVVIGEKAYSRYERTHTLFIRAVDDREGRSEAAYRSFTSRTLAPYAVIETPRNPFPGMTQTLPPIVRFVWRTEDPVDTPGNIQEADSIRYFLIRDDGTVVSRLNSTPQDFEDDWRPWISCNAPGDSGVATTIGDDELLTGSGQYAFAVQAMDEAGAVTTVFDPKVNVRTLRIMPGAGPLLRVSEPYLGTYSFVGSRGNPETFTLPSGFEFRFSWEADASSYGGEISSYRYGWDVCDLNDPNDWDVIQSPYVMSCPPIRFVSGVHTIFIEATDNNGISTLARMEVSLFPLRMNRNLLWVDDFHSTYFQQITYSCPTEQEHDDFWLEICSRADGFEPDLDVHETYPTNGHLPNVERLWQYKNIIWSCGASDRINTWDEMIFFVPESEIGSVSQMTVNYLSLFVTSGGHIWTEGRSDGDGGLSTVFWNVGTLLPANLRCEITGTRPGCDGDTSGVFSMPYKDYCVTVIDEVGPKVRIDSRMPTRKEEWDAIYKISSDCGDPVTAAHPGLPRHVGLWEPVTRPGKYFDPMVRGFTYVEIYNPEYWMSASGADAQACFHPMYRIRTRDTHSAVDRATVAFWTTRWADVVAEAPGAVAAPSVQFGLPLWFFNHAQTDSIADVIFREWQISAK